MGNEQLSFEDRTFLGHQAVYEQILRGEVPAEAVEAAMMTVTLTESAKTEGER